MAKYQDPDIFGSGQEEGPAFRDPEIFAPPPAAPKEEPKAPAPEPTIGDKFKANPMLLLSPWGMAGEGMDVVNKAIERLAYNVGGTATDVAAKVLPAERTSTAQYLVPTAPEVGYMANIGTQYLPTYIAGRVAKAYGTPAMEDAGRNMMQRAVKPTLADQQTGKGARAIETMLKEGVNPTQGGVENLTGQVGKLNAQVQNAIQGSSAVIDKNAVASRADEIASRLAKQVNPEADLAAVNAAKAEFLARQPNSIPVQAAQELKSGTYKSLGNKAYGELKGATIETQKALARGLKEEIAAAVPEVQKPLARESELMNAVNVMKRRAMMGNNRDLAGITTLSENPYAWAAGMADRSTLAKSLIARALYSNANWAPQLMAQLLAAKMMSNTAVAPGESPVLDLTSEGALFSPPNRGAPRNMLGGGSR